MLRSVLTPAVSAGARGGLGARAADAAEARPVAGRRDTQVSVARSRGSVAAGECVAAKGSWVRQSADDVFGDNPIVELHVQRSTEAIAMTAIR
jgi:hypothetical protein